MAAREEFEEAAAAAGDDDHFAQDDIWRAQSARLLCAFAGETNSRGKIKAHHWSGSRSAVNYHLRP